MKTKEKRYAIKKFSSINIVIVGLGGTGSHLVSHLLQMLGISKELSSSTRVVLIDGDSVEPKNLRNQKYLPEDIGKKKAEVLATRYGDIYPSLDISYVPEYLEDKSTLNEIFASAGVIYRSSLNILVGCVDNVKARVLMESMHDERECAEDLIYIDTGNGSGDDLTGQVVISRSIRNTKNEFQGGYRNLFVSMDEILPRPSFYFPSLLVEEDEPEEASCGDVDPSTIQNIAANILSASTVFMALNDIINFKTIPGSLYVFDAKEMWIKRIN